MGPLPLFPIKASTVAPQVDGLHLLLIGLGSFFSLIVIILIVSFGIKYHRSKQDVDRSNPPTENTLMELSWIFGLFFLSAGVFGWATKVYIDINNPPEQALEIYVVGKQWMWKLQHPEGPREINTLHIPADTPVRLIMASQDVIHSFYVPAFRLKQDVVPGRLTTLNFTATTPGTYHLFCAEYCGTEHAEMIGQVIVMEPRQYQEWLATGTQPGAQAQPMADSGAALFEQLGCSSCHTGESTDRAPTLEGLFGEQVQLADGSTVVADENYIRESILKPQAKVVAGYSPIMPTYEDRVSEEEILQLIDYVKSLGSGQGAQQNQ